MATDGAAPVREQESSVRGRRPRGIAVLAAIVVLQGAVLAVLGSVMLVARSEPELREAAGGVAPLITVAVLLLAVGVVRVVLGVMLARGNEVGRFVLGALAVLQIAITTFSVVALREVEIAGLVGLAMTVLELWLLYGWTRVADWFEP